jgi:uncharacterized protein (TIGR03435 family)
LRVTLGPNPPKLKPSAQFDDPPPTPRGFAIGKPDERGFPMLPPGYSGVVGQPLGGHMRLAGQRVPLAKLTPWLENSLDRPIVDQTGLTGDYDFAIDFEWLRSRITADADPAPRVPSAVEHDLGLKLVAKKLPFPIMIIDHLDPAPTGN